jgi:hypothetical protein
VHRPQQERRAPYPVGQGRTVEGNTLASIDLSLPIERKMVGELRYQHLGDGRLGGQPALDQARRRWCLHDHVRASAAAVFRPAHDQHPELRRHDVQALRDVLADAMQRPRAARADHALDVDHRLDPRQMRRQLAAVDPTSRRSHLALGWILLLGRGLARRCFLLGILQRKLKLILGQALGPAPEAMTLELPDDLAQPIALHPLGDQHRLEQARIVRQGIGLHTHPRSESQPLTSCERFDAVRYDQLAAVGTTVRRGS